MPVPSYPQFEQLLFDLQNQPDKRFRAGIEQAFGSAAENLANGDDVILAFKWLCNDLEQLAFEGFPITPQLYQRIEEIGRSLKAPPEHCNMLARYVK